MNKLTLKVDTEYKQGRSTYAALIDEADGRAILFANGDAYMQRGMEALDEAKDATTVAEIHAAQAKASEVGAKRDIDLAYIVRAVNAYEGE